MPDFPFQSFPADFQPGKFHPLGLWLGLWLGLLAIGGGAEKSSVLSGAAYEGEFVPNPLQMQSVSDLTKGAKSEWLLAPIPSLSPGQGFGLQAVVARIFHAKGDQPSTPPSMFGLAAMATEQESYALGLGYNGHLMDDRWRVIAAGGYVNFKSDYYGVGNSLGELGLSIPLEQRGGAAMGQIMRRLRPGLYGGIRLLALRTTVIAHGPSIPPVQLPDLVVDADMFAVSPVFQWDTRDNTFAPNRGDLIDCRVDVFGGAFRYRSTTLAVNHYATLGPGVLACRGYLQVIDGDAPFFALCSFGQGSDLRGYTSGQYRDRKMYAVQAEYRWRLGGRWGLVAFAGAGQVAPSLGDFSSRPVLASAGGGIRFRLTKENPVNFRCDYAWGRDGGALYFGVGEAF